MRGTDDKQASMFSIVSPERRIPADHPLRRIKAMADAILADLSATFDAITAASAVRRFRRSGCSNRRS
jgi:hypothetical protein